MHSSIKLTKSLFIVCVVAALFHLWAIQVQAVCTAPTVPESVNIENGVLTWSGGNHAYAVRVEDVSDGETSIYMGSPLCKTWPNTNFRKSKDGYDTDLCSNEYPFTSIAINYYPGHDYRVWIHGMNSCGEYSSSTAFFHIPLCVGLNHGTSTDSAGNFGGSGTFIPNGPDSQSLTYTLKVVNASFASAMITVNNAQCATLQFPKIATEGSVSVFRGEVTYGQVKTCNFNWNATQKYLQLNGYAGNNADPRCVAYAQLGPPNSVTPTPTPPPPPTATATPTTTPSPTLTYTPTPTFTPSPTFTPTNTPTTTPTPTNTPSPTPVPQFAHCDLCGKCRDIVGSAGTIQPENWETCRKCIYPEGVDSLQLDENGNPQPRIPGRYFTQIGCVSTELMGSTFTGTQASANVANQLLNVVVGVAGGLTFLYTLYAAVKFMVSRGNSEALGQATETLRNALIGGAFTYGSIFVVKVIASEVLKIPALK